MSSFQNETGEYQLLELLMKLYQSEFITTDEATQRVNPTGSEDTARRDRSSSKLLSFEEQTKRRAKKMILQEINKTISRIEASEKH